MRDGDIYRWRWKDNDRDADCGPYRSYHCCSQKAVVQNGVLRDTFWYSVSDNKVLKPDEVILELRGNIDELDEVFASVARYLKPSDVIDMRHSNNSSGPIYARKGAQCDPDTMLDLIAEKRASAESEIRMAQRSIREMDKAKALVEAGRLDEVWV